MKKALLLLAYIYICVPSMLFAQHTTVTEQDIKSRYDKSITVEKLLTVHVEDCLHSFSTEDRYVSHFRFTIAREGQEIQEFDVCGHKLPAFTKDAVNKLKAGDKVSFENIKARLYSSCDDDKTEIPVPPLVLLIVAN